MRALILIMILLVPLSSKSFAMDAGGLYQNCKPYADRAFKGLNSDDLICLTYFRAVADSGWRVCNGIKAALSRFGDENKLAPGLTLARRAEGLGLLDDNVNAAIQSFVNEMSSNPEKWRYSPIQYVHSSLRKLAPCK